jgi:hypothetical protein
MRHHEPGQLAFAQPCGREHQHCWCCRRLPGQSHWRPAFQSANACASQEKRPLYVNAGHGKCSRPGSAAHSCTHQTGLSVNTPTTLEEQPHTYCCLIRLIPTIVPRQQVKFRSNVMLTSRRPGWQSAVTTLMFSTNTCNSDYHGGFVVLHAVDARNFQAMTARQRKAAPSRPPWVVADWKHRVPDPDVPAVPRALSATSEQRVRAGLNGTRPTCFSAGLTGKRCSLQAREVERHMRVVKKGE